MELSNISETHQLCTSEMLIDETACQDMRIEAARALAMSEREGEEYVSRTIGFLRVPQVSARNFSITPKKPVTPFPPLFSLRGPSESTNPRQLPEDHFH